VQRLRGADGTYRWFQNNGFPLRDAPGEIVRWCVLLTDIDERKRAEDERRRAETQLAGEIRLLEMVAAGCTLSDVLDALCRFVEDTATNCHCGVYLIDWSGPTFHNAAAPTLPASFNDPIEGVPVRLDIGPCARAACLKTQVIAADIESDPLWQEAPFRVPALTNGLRSCWSTPIYSLAGHVLGTFAIYQRTPASPTPLQQDLIAQVTHISIKYLHAVGHAIRDKDNQLEYIAAVQDVTERRLSEDALAGARSELAKVARATSLGVLALFRKEEFTLERLDLNEVTGRSSRCRYVTFSGTGWPFSRNSPAICPTSPATASSSSR
jgi:GAF domain-containing protein